MRMKCPLDEKPFTTSHHLFSSYSLRFKLINRATSSIRAEGEYAKLINECKESFCPIRGNSYQRTTIAFYQEHF